MPTVNGSPYKVTAIVSTYNSEKFIRGCLEDLLQQTLGDKLEIIVIDSGSEQNERQVVLEYQADHPNIVYVRTKRESIYQAWNRGVRLAQGDYITNANTDDRHKPEALEVLARALDNNPEVAVAYGDVLRTTVPNETFARNSARDAFQWGEFSQEKLLAYCCIGPQPMWRCRIHDEIGYFDEQYKSAGDYDFWVRISEKYKLLHIDEILGLYLDNPQSLEHKDLTNFYESIDLRNRFYLRRLPAVSDLPLVSVIISTYNRPKLLKFTLQSLVEQTYQNWEALVVNDGGEGIEGGKNGIPDDPRIKIFNLPENHERSYCRNFGIEKARGKYLCFIDDDDIFYRHHLELAARTLETLGVQWKVLYTAANIASAKIAGDSISIDQVSEGYNYPYDPDRLLVTNYIPILSLLFRAEVLKQGEKFDVEMNCLEDLDLLIRISRLNAFYHLPVITNEIRFFKPYDAVMLRRHSEIYRMLYDRYREYSQDAWDIGWNQEEWLRSVDLDIMQQTEILPKCTLIVTADRGRDAAVQVISEIQGKTGYRNYDLLCLVPEDDRSTRDLLELSTTKIDIVPYSRQESFNSALNRAAETARGKLLLFFDSACMPATQHWLGELVREFGATKSGIISGIVIESGTVPQVRDASYCLNRDGSGAGLLYNRFMLFNPVIRQLREVDALAPGAVLAAKRDFANVGGFDPELSHPAGLIDLCMKIRQKCGKPVILNPFSICTLTGEAEVSAILPPADEFTELRSRWGNAFLRSEEDWLVADGLWSRDVSTGKVSPHYEGIYRESIRQAEMLARRGRIPHALMTLEAMLNIYPENHEVMELIQGYLKQVSGDKA